MDLAIKNEIEQVTGIPCTITRSDRQSLALQVTADAQLVVRAPRYLSKRFIINFVNKKRQWILKKQNQAQDRARTQTAIVFENGQKVPCQGESYSIVLTANNVVQLSDTNILLPRQAPKDKFISWMRNKALEALGERVAHYSAEMQIKHGAVKISAARTRWGSCSPANNLNFTWRLFMCPPEVIDYVVVHELSHVLHKNHGPAFWAQVAKGCPDYRTQRLWLKNNRKIMDII